MLSYMIQCIFALLPDTRLFRAKAVLLRLRGFEIGSDVSVVSSAKFKLKNLSIGDGSFIGHETLIAGGDAWVKIGKNVDIAPRCLIVTGTHAIGGPARRAGEGISLEIVIGSGTWIGAHCTIIGGVTIGSGCIIAAGSLVNKDMDDDQLIAGIPAKEVRDLS